MPFLALVKKETYRFSTIWIQTILGPLTTALLYQLIFGTQMSAVDTGLPEINYGTYLIPGLIMMQILLNSFANSSSSLIQSKYLGNIIFVLMAPISVSSMYYAYLLAGIIRGVIVGMAVLLGVFLFGHFPPFHLWAIVYFALIGASITAGLGVIAGILCDKFDQLAGIQSFIMVPLIYLSGIFFNVQNFSPLWHSLAMLDPFLYIVDGFRYGFIGHANFNLCFGMIFVLLFSLLINLLGIALLKRGIKIKH